MLVSFIYHREGRTAGPFYRIVLAGLRVALILLALGVFLPQLRLWFERQGWPDVAIIIDDSRSMSHIDGYQDARVREAAERLAGVGQSQHCPALAARPDACSPTPGTTGSANCSPSAR